MDSNEEPTAEARAELARRHLQFGWWCLFAFSLLGVAFEVAHAMKASWYVAASAETRRLMLTLGHAHGALLALLNIAFAASLPLMPRDAPDSALRWASRGLRASAVLMPAGFLGGGIVVWAGDPGPAILLVPVGAVLLLAGLLGAARACAFRRAPASFDRHWMPRERGSLSR